MKQQIYIYYVLGILEFLDTFKSTRNNSDSDHGFSQGCRLMTNTFNTVSIKAETSLICLIN